jgi:hypothetical protein
VKLSTEIATLKKLSYILHNPQVVHAYAEQPFMRKALICRSSDTVMTMVLKFVFFYLVCGRLATASTTPMMWTTKIDRSLRAQFAIAFRPTERRKFKFGKYDRNIQLHIPHYNGDKNPKIPSFRIGQYSARVFLKDRSTILVHGESEEVATKMVKALMHYVLPEMVPKEPVISITKRVGRALTLTGREVRAFRGDYYPPATQTPDWSVQL